MAYECQSQYVVGLEVHQKLIDFGPYMPKVKVNMEQVWLGDQSWLDVTIVDLDSTQTLHGLTS